MGLYQYVNVSECASILKEEVCRENEKGGEHSPCTFMRKLCTEKLLCNNPFALGF
jgi:hypothetical protein